MSCIDPKTGALTGGVCSCMMCKRLVLNAGIKEVIVRETETEYTVYNVADWIENDDSLSGKFGY
jgi:dCMP deaminase